ncbi:hypothetical protein CAPTEDRAFT_197646 [Capitella teleta]|uniref:Exonuclease domain-containing protein n=1 Tax=Capitella teleta TaxID=283909 RepID=R7UUJ6_CAPTE|nr:hypothetical protein CAPTEDRAFT_197646 [Capitella teleta]|eukprot:ELU09865.1 hypothetical protein CAPTEDRAFT_197646 [Capitella teleta]
MAKYHVYEDNEYYDTKGYISTIQSEETDDERDEEVYSLDCEMVYTRNGSEVAKITVVDQDLDLVYEQLVKPASEVIDCNTRFSGLRLDDLVGVTTTLEDVQAALLRLCSAKTILLGHSLEHDLIVLKLVHRTVVDTSVVFPHRQGPPYKKGLKKLCEEYLGKKIRVNPGGGHDSREDASACMELMKYWV